MDDLDGAALAEHAREGPEVRGQGVVDAIFEAVHGSAPDLAGRDLANPIGAIGSAAMLLRHSLGLEKEAAALEAAIFAVLAQGFGTADLACQPARVGTRGMGEAIRQSFSRVAMEVSA